MIRELPKAYEPREIEERWAEYWVRERLFDVSGAAEGSDADASKFVMLLPPPNVTGRLHMGHMLNQTEMDILTRWHRMRGERGAVGSGDGPCGDRDADDGGAAACGRGQDTAGAGARGLRRAGVGVEGQYGGAITEQMRRLGASVDWSREYFTMDERLSRRGEGGVRPAV